MKATQLFKEFFESEKAGGLVLIASTLVSLTIANSIWGPAYLEIFENEIMGMKVSHWINDGLMTIFFLLIGLELEREIYIGELSNGKEALLPAFGALGGIVIPAGIFLAFNIGTETQAGAGIPMATDIAFALGIISLLGNRVPTSLKVFLTALAVIDDLGAILIIALFYTSELNWPNLFLAFGTFGILLIFNRLRILNLIPYLLGGGVMWYFMHHSGIHATITGVLLAFAIPFGNGDKKSPSYLLQHFLHTPVAFFILPVFALANTAIAISGSISGIFTQPLSLGISTGLLIGKPLGILVLTFLAVKLKICQLPSDLNWKSILGVGMLGGIGFTMSIFITLLAFDQSELVNQSKLIILLTSFTAGVMGLSTLHFLLKPSRS